MAASLHTHSFYSLLEATSSPDALLRRAEEGGLSALALTDTNNLYGVVPFVEQAARYGVRPIVGACLEHGGARAVALVADDVGYRNLCRVISVIKLAEVEEERPLPDLLAADADGLHLLVDDAALAERLFGDFRDRLWVEIVRPRPEGERHEEALLACAKRLGLRVVASSAARFAGADEYHAFRLAAAIRGRTLLDRLPRALAATPENRLLSAAEMRRRFADRPEALRGGDELAGLLRAGVLPRDLVLPPPRLRASIEPVQYLRALCERGLRERDKGGDLAARERLRKELAIIEANDLAGYFLTVRDIARMARRRNHTMALRGSAGNSLVCYLLGITDVDPLRFGLEMERFLHPGRADLPDIDLDFDWKVRDAVIAGVIERYGARHVARISSHLFLQPRSAFREAGKLHGLSSDQISELLLHLESRVDEMLLPDVPEGTRGDLLPVCEAPVAFPLEAPRWARIVRDARLLLGRPTHLSLHPGGIVITPRPVEDYVPLQWAAKGLVMTQFEKDAIEHIGLVKIDLLGNRALSTVDEARLHAAPVPAAGLDGDKATLDLLRTGDTLGITQLESPAMRHLLIQMRPDGVEEVIQALALLRPGAASIGMKDRFVRRRRGLEVGPPAHPSLDRLLGETHGMMLYEDDSLRVIQALTGLPAAEADHLRKRISKHRTEEEAESLRAEFMALCEANGAPAGELEGLWAQLAKFNRYSFCKSHAVSYGLIAWQAAYLKAHHPVAFWSAALNNARGAYARWVYVEAVKRAGVEVLLPCVNRSALTFRPEGAAIRTGLEAVAGLPAELPAGLVAERGRGGAYADMGDLRRRVAIGPEALAALIRSGAMDFTGKSRPGLVLEARLAKGNPSPPDPSPKGRGGAKAGPALAPPLPVGAGAGGEGLLPRELFATDPTEGWSPPDDPPERRWRDEWQSLGFVRGPTLFSLLGRPAPPARGVPLVASTAIARHVDRLVRVQGLVATARHVLTEAGRPVQFVTLHDEYGLTEVTLFDGTCAQIPYLTLEPYVATGVVEERYGAVTLTARRFERTGPD